MKFGTTTSNSRRRSTAEKFIQNDAKLAQLVTARDC